MRVVGVQAPLPVRERASVATLMELLLENVDVVPVPHEEVALRNAQKVSRPRSRPGSCAGQLTVKWMKTVDCRWT